jgi:hypothetical protein
MVSNPAFEREICNFKKGFVAVSLRRRLPSMSVGIDKNLVLCDFSLFDQLPLFRIIEVQDC